MHMSSDYFYMMDIFLFDENISSVKNEKNRFLLLITILNSQILLKFPSLNKVSNFFKFLITRDFHFDSFILPFVKDFMALISIK